MYRWCVEEQLSSSAIHKRLTLQGVPTRHHNRRGWAQSTVIEILRDAVSKGDGAYNRTGPGDTQRPYRRRGLKDQRPGNRRARVRRPQEEWIPVRVPVLIDPETWELAQVQLPVFSAKYPPVHVPGKGPQSLAGAPPPKDVRGRSAH